MPQRLRSPRLEGFDYRGPLAAHLVFVTRERARFFSEQSPASTVVSCLLETSTRLEATLHAYCVMPDHVHALVEMRESGTVTEFPRRFKQLTGFRLKQQLKREIWQVSYYDHILRTDEDVRDVAHYIWNNPVEDGFVEEYSAYPFSGPVANMTAWNR